jgi:hypothetical protein
MPTAGTIGTPDVADLAKELARRAGHQHVVAQRVQRAVVSVLLVKVRGEDRDVHGQHAAGVVAHQQRAAGRHVVQSAHFRPEIALEERPEDSHDALGQARIPLGEFRRLEIGRGHGVPSLN